MKRGLVIGVVILVVVLIAGIIAVKTNVTGNLIFGRNINVPCADSDGGITAFVKGTASMTIKGKVTSSTDSCSGTGYVTEYYCKKGFFSSQLSVTSTRVKCEKGCKNGACSVDSTKKLLRKTTAGLVYGDANLDGVFDLRDLNILVDMILLRQTPPTAGSNEFVALDVNADGVLNMADLNLDVDVLMGRISKFPIDNLEMCTDSDDGLDYLVKGSTYEPKFRATYNDKCVIYDGSYSNGGYSSTSTGSCSGRNCYIREYSCDKLLNNLTTAITPCNNGCANGACIAKPILSKPTGDMPSCVDSDGGRDYAVKGTLTISYVNETTYDMPRGGEYCYGGTADYNMGYKTSCSNTEYCYVMEYGCEDIQGPLAQYSCANGCSNGACIS